MKIVQFGRTEREELAIYWGDAMRIWKKISKGDRLKLLIKGGDRGDKGNQVFLCETQTEHLARLALS